MNKILKQIRILLPYLMATTLVMGCSEQADEWGVNSGYVQFILQKASETPTQSARLHSELDHLSDAKKVELTIAFNRTTIKQTLNLNAYNNESAAYGVTSDKLELLAGNYTVIGYRLFNGVDEVILEGVVDENTFEVVPGGLAVKRLPIAVTPRGKVRFKLQKEFSDVLSKTASTNSYLFQNVRSATITIKNTFTQELTTFEKLPFSYYTYVEGNGSSHLSSAADCDTTLWLKAGNYMVTAYYVYNRSGTLLEYNTAPQENLFAVADNKTVEAKVPVSMYESAEHIKDYFALKAIWEALDGKNWYYYGQNYTNGINWNFHKDVDMWGNQPGVSLDSNGRVVSLIIGSFGPKGAVPAALGQLTELTMLSLGSHADMIGGAHTPDELRHLTDEERRADRYHYAKLFVNKDLRAGMSKLLVETLNKTLGWEFGNAKPFVGSSTTKGTTTRDVVQGALSNGISSLPEEIGNLKKLTHLSIANGHVAKLPTEGFSKLESLTDLEIYNCSKMVEYPEALNRLPNLIALNFARNSNIPAAEMLNGWSSFAASGLSNKTIQILYLGFNNLEELPESFNRLEKIGYLEATNNKISKIHPLGKNVSPVQLYLDHNLIREVPLDADGRYCVIDDLEHISFANNLLTELPNMFDANATYQMVSVDLSFNNITKLQGAESGVYKGVKVETLSLAGNKIKEFPHAIFEVGSTVFMLNVAGNGMERFDKDLSGKNLYLLQSIDLSYNNLTKLPNNFNASTLPYLYGIDVSRNCFSDFPYGPLNISRLTVMIIRSQRDKEGNRTLRTWPTGLYTSPSLRAFYIGGNDLRKIDDVISYRIYMFEIADNPNITIDLSDVCAYIGNGSYQLVYDPTQDIRGCDLLNLDN